MFAFSCSVDTPVTGPRPLAPVTSDVAYSSGVMYLPALTVANTSYLCTGVSQHKSRYRAPSLTSTLLHITDSTEHRKRAWRQKIFPCIGKRLVNVPSSPPSRGHRWPETIRLMQIPLQRSCSLVTSVGNVGYTRDVPASGETNRRARRPPFVGVWVQRGRFYSGARAPREGP